MSISGARWRAASVLIAAGSAGAAVLALAAGCSSGMAAGHRAGGTGPAARVPAESVRVGPYTEVYAATLPANPAQAQVIEGFRQGFTLWYRSDAAFHLVAPVRDYVTGNALTNLIGEVEWFRRRDLVNAGADRLFMTRVSAITGPDATVTTCDDQSGFREENARTGKIDPRYTPSPSQDYLFETWRMVRLRGRWAITGMSIVGLPSRRAERCQPGLATSGLPGRPNMAVLLRKVDAAMRGASSVHVSGTARHDGKTLRLNLSMTRSGGVSGQISVGRAGITILATRAGTYLKLNPAFLRLAHLPAAACAQFCGMYLRATTALSRSLLNGVSMASLTASVTHPLTPTRKVIYEGIQAVDGQPAWLLEDLQGNTDYVAARGKPYLLRQVAARPGEGAVSLTQWNAARIPGPPPASQIVHLNQLMA